MTKIELQKSLMNFVLGKRVYFLWSGGEDSNLLLRIILDYNLHKECNITVITVPFPQHIYSKVQIEICNNYLTKKGIDFRLLNTENDFSPDINYADACPLCKLVRREKFLEYYLPLKKDGDIIITGHNLSDLMSYYVEQCIMQLRLCERSTDRYLEVSNKFLRTYDTENGIKIYRPLLDFLEPEIHSCLIEKFHSQIQIVSQKCFWSKQRKRLIQEYFAKANITSNFNHVRNLYENKFGFPSIDVFRSQSFDKYLV